MSIRKAFATTLLIPHFAIAMAQLPDTITIDNVTVSARRVPMHSQLSVEGKEIIGSAELIRAACCNLGESFTTNPSVDVNYSDAATGAQQIKLLGLSGTYVQMLQENVPAFRQVAIPFGLSYVPGPWMQSIQVSKGAASVKNGYESITGQIDIEYKKPQGMEGLAVNAYYDSKQTIEANLDGALHLNDNLSTSILFHIDNSLHEHDQNNDGFMDMPMVKQYNLMDRWCWRSRHCISQLSVRGLHEERKSGTVKHHGHSSIPYGIDLQTDRIEGQWKNALLMRTDKNESLALIIKGVYHDADNSFGQTDYLATQKNAYAQLMYELDATENHNISIGASFNHDYLQEKIMGSDRTFKETTPGAYAQYTYKYGETLTAMAGIRIDHSSLFGTFVTPRFHLKYQPKEWITARLAAGKGYRTPQPLAENFSLLASSRQMICAPVEELKQEKAWNIGGSLNFNLPIGDENLFINTDYYYTDFVNQAIIDRDIAYNPATNQPGAICIYQLPEGGKSYSQVVQIDATYPIFPGCLLTAAYRYQDVQITEWTGKTIAEKEMHLGTIQRTPVLTSRYKALLTASYKTPLEMWQFDLTYQHNGPGRLPDCYDGSWPTRYHAYGQLSAQITREFQYFSVYIGGENLTNYKQKNPIISASNPMDNRFDATMIWGPTEGAMGYIGFRFNLEKY